MTGRKAREVFNQILDMPADSLSRSVALHGLGKMTIHDGEFKKGLALMERAVEEYPLALAYRNLAVYWNSENDPVKGNEYTRRRWPWIRRILQRGLCRSIHGGEWKERREGAQDRARATSNLMPASYNLAAIFAQNGQRDKALQLLHRHFFQYERYQAVREKEMMEARVDAVFVSIQNRSTVRRVNKWCRRQTADSDEGHAGHDGDPEPVVLCISDLKSGDRETRRATARLFSVQHRFSAVTSKLDRIRGL